MNKIKLNSIFTKINFDNDLFLSKNLLNSKINNSNILVIGGAGTIGSSYIKQDFKIEIPYWRDSLKDCIEKIIN